MIVTADHLFMFTQDELDRIQIRRPVFGVLAIILLSTGYALFVRVIGEDYRKRTRLETEVAVDYFDMIKISDDEVVIAIADVSGHGVGAGILSAMTKSALRAELYHSKAPSELLFNLNNAIYQVTDKNMFVSFAYVLLDRRTMTAQIATAGHPPIFLFRKSDGAIVEARTPNLALAVQPSTSYTAQTISLNRGDELILYTDGITEASNDKGEQYGVEQLKDLITDTQRPSVEALSNSILASVRAFTVKKEFVDDATIVVVRV